MPERQRYLVQVDQPGEDLDLEALDKLLSDTGVKLDQGYRPIRMNRKLGRVVARGWASDEQRKKAESLPGVRLFVDGKIGSLE